MRVQNEDGVHVVYVRCSLEEGWVVMEPQSLEKNRECVCEREDLFRALKEFFVFEIGRATLCDILLPCGTKL